MMEVRTMGNLVSSGLPRMWFLRILLVSSLCAIAGLATAQVPAVQKRLVYPVFIPKGDVTGTAGHVTILDIWGNAEDQIAELFVQCQIQGVIDLGRGWESADPERAEGGYPSPDAALGWPAFEARRTKEGQLPSLQDVLARFFRARPAFSWRIDKGGLVWIEPRSRQKRMGWLLERRFTKRLVSDVDPDKGWVVRGEDVEEAVRGLYPVWKRSRTSFLIAGRDTALGALPEINVYTRRETSVHSLGEFVRLWLRAQPGRYVVIKETRAESGPKVAKRMIALRMTGWNPARLQATTAELVEGLKKAGKLPAGYAHPSSRVRDCFRDLARRYHFERDAIRDAIRHSNLMKDAYSPFDLADFLLRLDIQAFGPYLAKVFWTVPVDVQVEMAGPLNWRLPENDPNYQAFWERLGKSVNAELRRISRSRLQKN